MKRFFFITTLLAMLLNLALGQSTSITVATGQSKVKKETFVYSTKDGVELSLDKYVDDSIPYQGKRPVLIYVHGGGYATGSRTNALQIQYGKHFVAQGYVSVAINYRLGLKGKDKPDQPTVMRAVGMATQDLIAATAFILSKEKEWNIDPAKIITSGGSAGAIACLTAEYDICSNGEYAKALPKDFNYAGIISHAGAIIVKQDALNWQKTPCPMLLMHGSKDQLVPFNSYSLEGNLYAGSNTIHEQLTKINVPHWLYEEAGADHIVALTPLQHNFSEIDSFLDKFVMKGQRASVHTVWTSEKPVPLAEFMKIVPLYGIGWEKTDDEVNAQKEKNK